ncbi:hypothetical protein CTheo_3404 [Ceratobasidium theobromae]|uniref:Transmembrane protein n=1 Tax=Ceratobasidium theobromae TaxID=1582974 RepID=A0A5N5QNA7_9AGAM|nr:hypothetical protein CTheo_3404 [Ceratobasidium theobromae]
MLSNLTIDDFSPIIQYDASWTDGYKSPYDEFVDRYQGGTFHCTSVNGSTATIAFRGTAIYIYGAKRNNHGYYRVSLNGEPPIQYDGYQGEGVDERFQTLLYERLNLVDQVHNLVLTNIVNGYRTYVDIDFVIVTRETNMRVQINDTQLLTIDDGDFTYNSTWAMSRTMTGYHNSTAHVTSTSGATTTLNFDGSEVFLYGGTGPTYGTFQVQVDDQSVVLNATTGVAHQSALLYTASGLGSGSHRLQVTNLQGGKFLDIDYAVYAPHADNSANSIGLKPSVIGGVVGGVVALLALLTLLIWYMIRKRGSYKRMTRAGFASSPESERAPMKDYVWDRSMIIEPFIARPSQPNLGHHVSGLGSWVNVTPMHTPTGTRKGESSRTDLSSEGTPRSGPSSIGYNTSCRRVGQTPDVHS